VEKPHYFLNSKKKSNCTLLALPYSGNAFASIPGTSFKAFL